MPTAVTELPARIAPRRKRWTRSECEALSTAGLLDYQHLELIEGELIDKMGKNQPHVNSVALLLEWLIAVFGARFVNSEAPIDVAPEDNPSSEPEPDLIVRNRDLSYFVSQKPRPQDLHLVIEVSDTTPGFDLTTKAALYARAEIVECWVLDVAARRMIVHRDPQGGRYTSIAAYGADEAVAPLAAPASELWIENAFAG